MREPVTINLGHGFLLSIPNDDNTVIHDLELTLKFHTRDEFSSADHTLKFPSEWKPIERMP